MQLQEETIFNEALEIESLDARRDYLTRVCEGRSDIRLRVEQLLHAFLDGEALEPTYDSRPLRFFHQGPSGTTVGEQVGDWIGPYKLLELLGEGGMGQVFMAEQTEPLRRKVALKVIKVGMDTTQVVARFEAERQALAMMNHPNIAKVLDAGATELGRPYFVMELVRGIPITDFCDTQKASLNERLQLFAQVCEAVHHAHQKGIIHRDIKPTNLLVELHDVKAVPKIIDFGIAKATNQQLTDKTLFTHFSQLLGTPLYMSPEQAQLSGLDIDVRSDVYSLGVLLFELLTGTTPVLRETMKSVPFDELRRIIREDDPPRASARISTLKAEQLSTLANSRRIDIRLVTQSLRGELDWIVAKALEKDRSRRYQSAMEFAEDLHNYLDGEPVEAHPPSMVYRLRKTIYKHRTEVAFGAVLVGALVAGTIVSLRYAWIAEQKTQLATENERRAETQTDKAIKNLKIAMDAVESFTTSVAENELLAAPGLQPLRKELLQKALDYYQEFSQNESKEELQPHLADANFRMGKIMELIGTKAEANRFYQISLGLRRALASGETPSSNEKLELTEAMANAGRTNVDLGNSQEAQAMILEAINILESEATEVSDSLQAQKQLATLYTLKATFMERSEQRRESLAKAVEAQRKILLSDPTSPTNQVSFALSNNALATEVARRGKMADCLKVYEQSLELLREVAHSHPEYDRGWEELATTLHELGMHNRLVDMSRAIEYLEESAKIEKRLRDENPTVVAYQRSLAKTTADLASLLLEFGQPEQGIEQCRLAIQEHEKLIAFDTSSLTYHEQFVATLINASNNASSLGQYGAARDFLVRAKEVAEAIFNRSGKNSIKIEAVIGSLAFIEAKFGNHAEAIALFNQVFNITSQKISTDPNGPTQTHKSHGVSKWALGRVYFDSEDYENASKSFHEAIEIFDSINDRGTMTAIAGVLFDEGRLKLEKGEPDEAVRIFDLAMERFEDTPRSYAKTRQEWHLHGAILTYMGEYETALKSLNAGFEIGERGHPNLEDHQAWWYYAICLARTGAIVQAKEILSELTEIQNNTLGGHDYLHYRADAEKALKDSCTSAM